MIKNDFGLSNNAVKIFETLYSFQGESIEETFKRVSKEYSKNEEDEKLVFNLLADGIWRPNTPAFLNAGTDHKIFSACYVVGLEDSMESIYDVADVSRKIFQFGSGVGIPIGNLRETDAYIYEGNPENVPEGKSSGPITFMKLYDAVGETTKSGGRVRRAAILCTLPVWHPDVMDFIDCKIEDGRLSNMNISVGITDKFMESLKDGIPFDLISPSDGKKVREIDPQELWDKLAKNAHFIADPGVLFLDNINKYNTLKKRYLIEATNPCGEQPLHPFSCCNLSAINISKFIKDDTTFDWDGFYQVVFQVMEFMDNVIDVMEYPDPRFEDNTLRYRPVGIGPMGLADAMYMMGIGYNTSDGRKFAGEVMRTMTTACIHKSALLAKEHEPFYEYDVHKEDVEEILFEHMGEDAPDIVKELVLKYGVKNSQYTTAQPTGTTALSCDASYGIEPIFGLVFEKNLISGEKMIVANQIFEQKYKNEKWYTDNLPERILNNNGSLKGLKGIPKDVREVFVVAHDIKLKDRIDMQAELQKYCSTAISSTVNLHKETPPEEIAEIYRYSYEKGLKGITVYRDGSKKNQPVTFNNSKDISDFTRPTRLSSNTFVMETGNGKMYVTVADYEGKPIELFISLGKSGQVPNTFTEGLGRIISISLQNGVPVEEITKTLIGINSDKPTWHRFEAGDKKPTQILSIPDGIAKLLNRYYEGQQYEGELGELCPKCSSLLQHIEGCVSCVSCGWSKCS